MDRDTMLNAAMQAIPYIGGSLATLYFGRKQERRFRRLESFYEEVRDEISDIHDRVQDPATHDAAELRAILEELHEKVESEHLDTKRRYYKTYFKSTLTDPIRGNFEERKLFLDILSALTPLQLEVLAFLVQQGKPVPAERLVKPGADAAVMAGGITQLKNFGLVFTKLDSISFAAARGGVRESVGVSEFGQRFHRFCIEGKA